MSSEKQTAGIITIHRIYNYGSVLQTFALQKACQNLGVEAEIIDYRFPNSFHANNPFAKKGRPMSTEPKWIKALFAKALYRQHKGIDGFVKNNLKLSKTTYPSPNSLIITPPVTTSILLAATSYGRPLIVQGILHSC